MNTMTVRLFASLKDRAGQPTLTLMIPLPLTVAELVEAAIEAYPALAPARPTIIVAVNKAFMANDGVVHAGDEVAFFPPVSGGAFPHPTYFALTNEPFDLNDIQARLMEPHIGAVIMFSGSVRGQTSRPGLPAETLFLEYEAYEAMALPQMALVATEIWARWPSVQGIAIVQRVGRVGVGDSTTLVACAAGHRDEGGFAATRYAIDRLKEIVPIWKKEIGADQSVWVDGDYLPAPTDSSPVNNS